MKSLDEAWQWYESTRRQLKLIQRLGRNYWDELPWSGRMGQDQMLSLLEEQAIVQETTFGLAHLDDLAIVVLFSVFESQVRLHVLEGIEAERQRIQNRAIRQAVEDALDKVAEGSFFHVLQPFKDPHADLVEHVNQVRRYRNWVAHGKAGAKPENVEPHIAYERLRSFLALLEESPITTTRTLQ